MTGHAGMMDGMDDMDGEERPQPAWLRQAWAEYGQREGDGAKNNPRIVKFYEDVGFGEVHHDEVAWCAAFVGACLERSGIRSTRLLLARSYLQHGTPIETGRLGAVVVLSRGSDPALGHVGFWLGETGDSLILLGGNQGDAVSVQAFAKGRLLGIRWPGPATVMPPSEDALFAAALAHVLEMEGGFTDDPHDPGGPTNKGITLETYAAWRGTPLDADNRARLVAELKAIADDEVARIYRERYWRPSQAGQLPAALAVMHFDAAVNHGVGGAKRMLQQALEVTVDGEIGPETLEAANSGSPAETVSAYAGIRRARYRGLPHFWRFGRGWLARVETTEQRALAMPGATVATATRTKGPKTMSETTTREQAAPAGKWWGESMTIWGVIVTTLATVLPVVGPLIGLDISAELVRQIGAQATQVMQALAGLAGTLMTVYGRARASGPLMLREMRIRL